MTFHMKEVMHQVKTTVKVILVALITFFWVSVVNIVANFGVKQPCFFQ
jgi:hypothetical protein